MKVSEQGDELVAANFTDVLTENQDGYFEFGIRLVLEVAPNSFPKTPVGFRVMFQLRDRDVEIKIADGSFNVNLDDASTRKPVYDFMVGLWASAFTQKPWEVEKKPAIGFL